MKAHRLLKRPRPRLDDEVCMPPDAAALAGHVSNAVVRHTVSRTREGLTHHRASAMDITVRRRRLR